MLPSLREQHDELAAAVRRLEGLSPLAAAQHARAILEQQLTLNGLLVASIEQQQKAILQLSKRANNVSE